MKKAIEQMPLEARAVVESISTLLTLYMPGIEKFEFLVGRNVKAKVAFEGGPITRDVIEDTMAHLAFYKKYFPKSGEDDGTLNTPEKIIQALARNSQGRKERGRRRH